MTDVEMHKQEFIKAVAMIGLKIATEDNALAMIGTVKGINTGLQRILESVGEKKKISLYTLKEVLSKLDDQSAKDIEYYAKLASIIAYMHEFPEKSKQSLVDFKKEILHSKISSAS